MNFKKLALSTAVAAVMGTAVTVSHAMVYGVAGEALLVPAVLNNPNRPGVGNTNTYVVLRMPTVLGSDFVLNNYTTPNLRRDVPASTSVNIRPDPNYGWKVHWTWFDPKSKNPINGTCEGSPNDVIIWTTDADLLDIQDGIDRGFSEAGTKNVPATYCGDAFLPPAGYVVFQTGKGADGLEADFALEGTAYITDDNITEYKLGLLSVPVIPMADGEDPDEADESTSPQIGLNEVIQFGGSKGNFTFESPVVVSPIATGIRMNDGNPTGPLRRTSFTGGVQGDYMGNPGYSMHVLWFDRNNPGRGQQGQSLLYDEHERGTSFKPPVDRELNILLFNASLTFSKPNITDDPWYLVNPSPATRRWVDITEALENAQSEKSYRDNQMFVPQYWDQTIMGYLDYILREEGTELGGSPLPNEPGSNASAVAFEAQEDAFNGDAWSQHLMTVRGFR